MPSVSAYGVVVSSTLLESRPRNLQVDYVADLSSGRYFGPYTLCTSSRQHLSLPEANRNINKRSSLFHQRRSVMLRQACPRNPPIRPRWTRDGIFLSAFSPCMSRAEVIITHTPSTSDAHEMRSKSVEKSIANPALRFCLQRGVYL